MESTTCPAHERLDVAFAFGVATPNQLPPEEGPEVAFAGRSNAGKSTALNAICMRRKLAFVSKTPGRTQQINFFRVATGGYLVDLPGYGFAKVAMPVRATWDRLIGTYMTQRAGLRAVVVVMDSRHPFTPLDLQLMDYLQGCQRPMHILLTKADKLNRQQCASTLRAAQSLLADRSESYTVQLFSGATGQGVAEARARVLQWLADASAPRAP